MADKRIEVNTADSKGATLFYMACHNWHIDVVSLLLADTRIDFKKSRNNITPFQQAYDQNHISVLNEFIRFFASKNASLLYLSLEDIFEKVSESFNGISLPLPNKINPEYIKTLQNEIAAEYFCLIVFLADSYLQEIAEIDARTQHFLTILKNLPIELQMKLCRFLVGSDSVVVSKNNSEPQFRLLAQYYAQQTKMVSTEKTPAASLDDIPKKEIRMGC